MHEVLKHLYSLDEDRRLGRSNQRRVLPLWTPTLCGSSALIHDYQQSTDKNDSAHDY